MHVSAVAALRAYYGLERRPVRVIDPGQMLGEFDEHNASTDLVARTDHAIARISPKWWPGNPGHVLVSPIEHFENLYTLPTSVGHSVFDLVQVRIGGIERAAETITPLLAVLRAGELKRVDVTLAIASANEEVLVTAERPRGEQGRGRTQQSGDRVDGRHLQRLRPQAQQDRAPHGRAFLPLMRPCVRDAVRRTAGGHRGVRRPGGVHHLV